MNTLFKILFMAEVLHDFYEDGACADFKFIPTAETRQLLANCKAMYKTVGNKLIVLIQSDENGKPFIAPKAEDKFCFYVELMNPLFMTVSSLDAKAIAEKRFYFTNLNQNKVNTAAGNDLLYLTKQVPAYLAGSSYQPGDFVKDSNVVYECIKVSPGGNAPGPASAFWAVRDKNQYAAANDLLLFVPQQASFPVTPPAAAVTISVFKLNPVTDLFDLPAMEQLQNFENPVDKVQADLSVLKETKYKVLVNGTAYFVYISNDAVYKNMFAVVELYNHLPNGNDFSFFLGNPDDGKLKDLKDPVTGISSCLTFSIRFANRLAFWKYLSPKKMLKSIDSTPSGLFAGNANPADFFTSQKPIALKQKPYEFKLTLFNAISREPPLAPNPDINASGMLTKTGADYYCIIYTNY